MRIKNPDPHFCAGGNQYSPVFHGLLGGSYT